MTFIKTRPIKIQKNISNTDVTGADRGTMSFFPQRPLYCVADLKIKKKGDNNKNMSSGQVRVGGIYVNMEVAVLFYLIHTCFYTF